jgi:hypothetical protein
MSTISTFADPVSSHWQRREVVHMQRTDGLVDGCYEPFILC